MTPVNPSPARPARVPAVDVMRGLVMALLLPDLSSGFGLERMAQMHPGSAFWHTLARPFGHVDWAGMALWDLVMPCSAFVIGAAMVFSRRAAEAEPGGAWWWHARALRRALVLVLMAWLLALLIRATPARPGALWRALVVLGSNAMLLYVLTYWERWRFVALFDALWQRLGGNAAVGGLAPLAQALWVLACLWLLAWGLYRARIFLRV